MQEETKLLFEARPELPYAIEEAVNRLRINISFLGKDVRKIMIASSEPNEGKSFVAFHLWDQIARSGEKAVLIDSDMRNSNMFVKYAMKRSDGKEPLGLSHYLSRDIELSEVLMHTDTPTGDMIPNVENIVNPSMLLENRKFEELLYLSMYRPSALFLTVSVSETSATARSCASAGTRRPRALCGNPSTSWKDRAARSWGSCSTA